MEVLAVILPTLGIQVELRVYCLGLRLEGFRLVGLGLGVEGCQDFQTLLSQECRFISYACCN